MSAGLGPRPLDHDVVRERARERARALTGPFLVVAASALALFAVVVFAVLDYGLGQQSHRIVKLLLGGLAITAIVSLPHFGLFLFPIALPMLYLLPKLPVPGVNTLNGLVLSVFLSFSLGRVLTRQTIFRSGALLVPIGVFLALCGIALLRGAAFPTGFTYEPGSAGIELFRTAMSFSVYPITLAMARGIDARRRIALAIVIGLAIEIGFTVTMGRDFRGRAVGTIGQSNELGAYLAMFGALSLALVFGVRAWWARLGLIAVTVGAVAGVFLSVSRGAIVSIALATLLVAARSSRLMLALLVVALLTSPLWTPDYVKERLASTQSGVEDTDEVMLDPGAQSRVNTWQTLMTIFQEHPLDGVGFDALGHVLPEAGAELGLRVKDSSHNTYLRVLAEVGAFGLLALLWLLWRCFRLCEAARHAATERFDRQLAVGASAALLTLVVACWFGDRFFNVMVTGGFWILCALLDDVVTERREART